MPITLRNAEDLFEVLRNPDAGVTLALHRSLCRAPMRALELGPFQGRDVVDELLLQAEAAGETNRGLLLTRTLSMFPTERVEPFFQNLFLAATRVEFLRVSAAWLAAQLEPQQREVLILGLMQNGCVARAREAARWLRLEPDLDPASQLRVSLLDTRDDPLACPDVDASSLAAWLAELRGPFQAEARAGVAALGREAVEALMPHEPALDLANREWLLRLAVRVGASGARTLVHRALTSGPDRLLAAALEGLGDMRDAGDLRALVEPCLRHSDPRLRRSAARVAADVVDWRAALEAEDDASTRRIIVERWAQRDGPALVDELATLLPGADWTLCATVADILVEFGDPIVEAMRALARDPDRGVHTTAIQVLMRLGEDEWVEEVLPP